MTTRGVRIVTACGNLFRGRIEVAVVIEVATVVLVAVILEQIRTAFGV